MADPSSTPPRMSAPTAADLLAKARDLTPLFSGQAEANERAGRLTDTTMAALRDNGFFGLIMPRCFGGTEAWPVEMLDVVEALSYADGSTGWVLMAIQVGTASAAAYLPPESAEAIFGAATPLIAGQGGAIGRADAVDGGYRLSGNWRYGSGLLHSQFIHTGAVVYENGRPRLLPGSDMAEARIFIVPIEQAELRGNWDVIGLRATGSIDYGITDLFVPDDYTHLQIAKRPRQGGDFYRLSIPGMGSIGHAGFALGVGRRILDELAALANTDPGRSGMISPPGGNDSFQEQFGAAEGRFRSARALVREAQFGVQAAVQRGDDPSTREITLARLALQNVNAAVAEVCAFAYKFAGGSSIRDCTIQRCWRDMFTGTQHASNSPPIIRDCGRELLGNGAGKTWGPRGLIDPVSVPETAP